MHDKILSILSSLYLFQF